MREGRVKFVAKAWTAQLPTVTMAGDSVVSEFFSTAFDLFMICISAFAFVRSYVSCLCLTLELIMFGHANIVDRWKIAVMVWGGQL